MEDQEVTKWPGQDYTKDFDPRLYLDTYFSKTVENAAEGDILPTILRFLHSTFSKGEVSGQRILDLGSGPTIYQVLSACENFSDIYLSDYVESNRRELLSWLQRSPSAFDWTNIIRYVCRLEGHTRANEKAERLRRAVKAVLPCDIFQKDPLLGSWSQGRFDCIVSVRCLEVACASTGAFEASVARVCRLLRPGGWLILGTDLGETYYHVGSRRFSVLPVDQESVLRAVAAAGLTTRHTEVYVRPEPSPEGLSDLMTMLFVRAQKI